MQSGIKTRKGKFMKMSFAQYCRVETLAGGVACTPREFIRAAHSLLNDAGKTRAHRDARHAWLRDGLKHRDDARGLYRDVMAGDLS